MPNEKLTELLLTENLTDILNRAESGDVLAAKEALIHMSLSLSDTRYPIPDYMREYLAKCLYRMAGGDDANHAMHLKRSGPKKWGHFEKRLAADLVFRLVEKSIPVLESVGIVADILNDWVDTDKLPDSWQGFSGRHVESETLQNWYYQLKAELAEIRQKTIDL